MVLLAVVVAAMAWWAYHTISEKVMEPTYRADRLTLWDRVMSRPSALYWKQEPIRMIDTPSKRLTRAIIYYLTLSGHPTDPKSDFPFINPLITLYLKHGGDPNRPLGGANKNPLIAGVA